ncbi:MAG: hypothetical protein HS108_01305 [Planctomycetes bacterium]|jgi:hypothetical protein|nr:hypothetical protein [Planctomycetota bacterium]MCL4729831.1 hypothetical protein [Planctomycetota bacterium]
MAAWKKLVSRSDLLIPGALAASAALIALDLVVFYAWDLRPLISYPEAELGLWSVLIASAWVWGARWLVAGEKGSRAALAGVAALMLALHLLHPFARGELRPVQRPGGQEVLTAPETDGPAVVEYNGGPFTAPRERHA